MWQMKTHAVLFAAGLVLAAVAYLALADGKRAKKAAPGITAKS